MRIVKIEVDELPDNCGKCHFCKYVSDSWPQCVALPDDISEIVGSPYDMKYRRSDCPLTVYLTSDF